MDVIASLYFRTGHPPSHRPFLVRPAPLTRYRIVRAYLKIFRCASSLSHLAADLRGGHEAALCDVKGDSPFGGNGHDDSAVADCGQLDLGTKWTACGLLICTGITVNRSQWLPIPNDHTLCKDTSSTRATLQRRSAVTCGSGPAHRRGKRDGAATRRRSRTTEPAQKKRARPGHAAIRHALDRGGPGLPHSRSCPADRIYGPRYLANDPSHTVSATRPRCTCGSSSRRLPESSVTWLSTAGSNRRAERDTGLGGTGVPMRPWEHSRAARAKPPHAAAETRHVKLCTVC